MDTVSQTLLGAAVGEATLGKKLGNQALGWGALIANLPDHDVLLRPFFGPVGDIAIHRTYSHSILFCITMAALLTPIAQTIYKKYKIHWKHWALYFFLIFSTHVLLDCFTTWGTQVFWPFSDYRVTFKSVFVIDPLYTLPFLICMLAVPFLKRQSEWRRRLTYTGLAISSFYLMTTLFNKLYVNQIFLDAFYHQQDESIIRYQSHPTPFNTIMWSLTAEAEDGYYIGYYSWFDEDQKIDFNFYLKNHHLLDSIRTYPKVRALLGITHGYYTVNKKEDTIIINNLRFGQTMGWDPKYRDFPFSYQIRPVRRNGKVDYRITRHAPKLPNSGDILQKFWQRLKGI